MALSISAPVPVPKLNRNIVIAGSVVLLHIAAVWALQSGLLRRAVEVVVPVALLTEFVTPPQPKTEPAPQPPAPPEPDKKPVTRQEQPQPPAPRAAPSPSPAPEALSDVEVTAMLGQPMAAAPATPAPPATAPAKVELPSSAAEYLQNPTPAYPDFSKRLGEQGTVLVRLLIGANGTPQKAELKRSSGFDRLDRAALEYVMKCRYLPGKIGGVPQAMWYDAPVTYVLE